MTVPVSASGGPISDERDDFELVRVKLKDGRRDSELLDGRDFDPAGWDAADAALSRCRAVLNQQEEALKQITKLIPSAEFAGSNAVFIARAALTGVRSDG